MAINPISFQMPQAFSGGIDFSPLANLGNVYRQGQEEAAKQAALTQLGNDPTANAQVLIRSGVPSLAQLGIQMQSQAREFGLRERQDVRAEAEAKRRQETFEQEQEDREKAAKLLAGLGGTPPTPAQSPFPSPATAPQGLPPSALQPQATPPPQGNPVVSALTSNQPTGIPREVIGQMVANPKTHDLGIALLQKELDPGTYSFQQVGDQLLRTNSRTGKTDIVMSDTRPIPMKEGENLAIRDPSAPGGFRVIQPEGGGSKEEREYQGFFKAGKNLGMTDDQAKAFAANKGKTPREDLTPAEEKRVNTLTDQVQTAQRTLANIGQLKELSKTAWGFPGAGTASTYGATFLPSWAGGKGAVDTQDLINAAHSNVANVAKTIFPQRVTNTDLKLLQELESSANQPDETRQRIYKRAEDMFNRMSDEATAEAESIRNKTFYKPGGAVAARPAAAPTTAPVTTGSIAKPPPDRIVNKARAAIAQGADPRQVRQHMIDNGYDPGDIGK